MERPFLIKNPMRAEEVRKGDYWGESDLDEKPRGKNRLKQAEEGVRQAGEAVLSDGSGASVDLVAE